MTWARTTKNASVWTVLLSFTLLMLVVLAYLGSELCPGCFDSMPSDAELRDRFFQNQADFTKLVEMSDKDPHITAVGYLLIYVDSEPSTPRIWPRTDMGFSMSRWNEYRRMFRKLRIERLSRHTANAPKVFLDVYAHGGVLGSSAKGYAYLEEPLTPELRTLDPFPSEVYTKTGGKAVVFKRLANNWYLFREEF